MRPALHDAVRAELFKLVRRPAAWTLLAAAVVLNQVFGYLIPYLAFASGDPAEAGPGAAASPQQALASTLPDQLIGNTISAFPVFAGALALVMGALVLGSEHGWGTVKTLFTQRPRRGTVVTAQLVALALALATAHGVLFAAGALTSAAIAAAEGRAMDWPAPATLAEAAAGGWLVLLVWALLGAALGVLLRGVALPIGLGVVWVLGIENLLSVVAGSLLTALQPLRDVLPGVNAGSLVAALTTDRVGAPTPGVVAAVGEPRAWLTLGAYAVVCATTACWVSMHRDVAP